MATVVTHEMKARAEVYHGDQTCREKFTLLLSEIGMPDILLQTLQDIEECGYVKDTGFVWLKNKKKTNPYRFENVLISLEPEITAYFRPNRIENLTGVKARELLIWFSLTEIFVTNSSPASIITFKTLPGFTKSFPISAFDSSTPETGEEVVQENCTERSKLYVYC